MALRVDFKAKMGEVILQYFVQMGHKVECYYKEPTDKTKRV